MNRVFVKKILAPALRKSTNYYAIVCGLVVAVLHKVAAKAFLVPFVTFEVIYAGCAIAVVAAIVARVKGHHLSEVASRWCDTVDFLFAYFCLAIFIWPI